MSIPLSALMGSLFNNTTSDPMIHHIAHHSGQVMSGTLFFALPGYKHDGGQFIPEALKKGAAAIVSHPDSAYITNIPGAVPVIYHPYPRRLLADVASRFYPAHTKCLAGVTGTNGKSSTVFFLNQLWSAQQIKSAALGTLGIDTAQIDIGNHPTLSALSKLNLTTPDALSLHKILHYLTHKKQHTHIAMEATSIGLDQSRLDGLSFDVAAFSNLSPDHLDYHTTMDTYFQAKIRLFTERLAPQGVAVLNRDDPTFDKLQDSCTKAGRSYTTYGTHKDSHIRFTVNNTHTHGQTITLSHKNKDHTVDLPFIGEFQAYNLVCALSMIVAHQSQQQDLDDSGTHTLTSLLPHLKTLKPPAGRLEPAHHLPPVPNQPRVFVDYAHTPDALKKALQALRPHTAGKLWVVFGCGGDRDQEKRPLMGKIAETYADYTIITDDNPRHEDPATIRSMVAMGAPSALIQDNRVLAIKRAITKAQPNDVILIAGKGHETTQQLGDQLISHDDKKIAAGFLAVDNPPKIAG